MGWDAFDIGQQNGVAGGHQVGRQTRMTPPVDLVLPETEVAEATVVGLDPVYRVYLGCHETHGQCINMTCVPFMVVSKLGRTTSDLLNVAIFLLHAFVLFCLNMFPMFTRNGSERIPAPERVFPLDARRLGLGVP